jgi:signal transduction histidine kinase
MTVAPVPTPPEVRDEGLEERVKALEDAQKATINILEDFDAERGKLEHVQKAMFNILDDFTEDRHRLEETHSAMLNILDDFDGEKSVLQDAQNATLNILEDFGEEKLRLEKMQRATFNILEDLDEEKRKAEKTGEQLRERIVQLRQADEVIRKLNEGLKRRAVELETINKEIESFSYSVSHDLRAPLRAIDGFSQALIEDFAGKLDDRGQDYLRRVRHGAQRMALLIDDMLNLSRVTRAEFRREEVDLTALAREVAAELRRAYPDREVELSVGEELRVPGDARLLRIAIENLLGNAWKFTRERSPARIELGGRSQPDGTTAYFVRDNGVGFDMAYSDKLFGAFHRLHNVREFPGTGIGLATVQRVVRKHGGRVWAEGEVDKGATFYFTLSSEAT